MTGKRYSHDAIVIVDHLKKDLIYIDGKDELLELAEYVDRLQEENEQLKKENEKLELLWEDKTMREYLKFVGETALQEMHNEKYEDK